MQEIKNTVIVGMGALGMLYGNQILKNIGRQDFNFVVNEERYKRYQKKTFTVQGQKIDFPFVSCKMPYTADLIIVAVKYNSLQSAIQTLKAFAGPKTIIMSVMNGISSEEIISQELKTNNFIYTVAQGMDAMRFENTLTYTKMGELRIGVRQGMDTSNLLKVKAYLDKARIPTAIDRDIIKQMWSKFMLNVGINQTCMIYNTTYSGALTIPEYTGVFEGAMDEVLTIANAKNIKLTKQDKLFWKKVIASLSPDGIPSMAQDRAAKRKSEVEMFSGTVIKMGKELNIPTPVNQMIYEKVQQIESAY